MRFTKKRKTQGRFNPSRSFLKKALDDFLKCGGEIKKVVAINGGEIFNNIDGQDSDFLIDQLYTV